MKKKFLIGIIVAILSLIFLALILDAVFNGTVPTNGVSRPSILNLWNVTPREPCIMGILSDYDSNTIVRNETEARNVFDEYIEYAADNNTAIFGYKNKWRSEGAKYYGLYKGRKYWDINASFFYDNPENQLSYNKWIPKSIFKVSEDGNVVRLLGCI